MNKFIKRTGITAALIAVSAIAGLAQDSSVAATKVVVNPDGSYTVVEYPTGQETLVNLLPSVGVTGSRASARVVRAADGTKIYFDVSGAPADWTSVHAYAVDPSGMATYLGPIPFTGGAGTAEFSTPMSQFMLVLSPTPGLSTYDTSTKYVYRSETPKGFAIVPRRIKSGTSAVAGTEVVNTKYEAPMLGVPKMNSKTTEVKVRFNGELQGLDGKAYLKPEGGKTSIKMRFSDLRKVQANKRLVLWAASPDGAYTKIGQVINTGSANESEIRGDTALSDFGLLVTVEDVDVERPTSTIYAPVTLP